MYTFVKLRSELHDIDYPWKLVCEDMETMNEHALAYLKPVIKTGMDDMIQHATKGYHISSWWASAMLPLFHGAPQGLNVLEASMTIEKDLYDTKSRMIEESGGVYLTDGPSYMSFSEHLTVVDTLVKENISFPHYSEEDIIVKRWQGGVHYYAQVGGLDVVIDGKQNWNDAMMARRMALKYLKEIS